MKWAKHNVVQSVGPKNCGSTQTTTGALYSYDAKLVALNGLTDSHTHASSQISRATVVQRVFSTLAQGRNFLWRSLLRLRKSSRRGDNQSPILVIYQLLLKINTKYWVDFERNVRAEVYS